jgi:PPOX class probable F420-dependent enzyme
MTGEPRAKNPRTTATPENALTRAEIDGRLAESVVARLGTIRSDGAPHVTPVWFLWEPVAELMYLSFGADRLHLRNMRRDPRITICVDEDNRPQHGIEAGAWAIVMRGRVELSQSPELIRKVGLGLMRKALGEDAVGHTDAEDYLRAAEAEGRWIATVTPEHWLAWDYAKV